MNFNLTTTEWHKIENLTDDKTYTLQAKTGTTNYDIVNILLTSSSAMPTIPNNGILADTFKFKKVSTKDIYIRTLATPVNIYIEEVE